MTRRTALPRQFKTEAQANLRNRLIVGIVLFAAVSGPFAVVVAGTASNRADEARDLVIVTTEPAHRAFAESAAARWAYGGTGLVASRSAADVGRPEVTAEIAAEYDINPGLLGSDGRAPFRVLHFAWHSAEIRVDAPAPSGVGRHLELHRFIVTADSGMFWLTIPVVEAAPLPDQFPFDVPVPVLGGRPTIEPYIADARAISEDGIPAVGWGPDFESTSAPEPVQARVEEWADAFAGDQRLTLYDITGSDVDGIEFAGLGNLRVVDVVTSQAAQQIAGNDEYWMVRTTLTMLGNTGVLFSSDYDMLVVQYTTPRPNIVAWGPAGAGPRLEPFENAVITGGQVLNPVPEDAIIDVPTPEAVARGDLRELNNAQFDYQAKNGVYSDDLVALKVDERDYNGLIILNIDVPTQVFCFQTTVDGETYHNGNGALRFAAGQCPDLATVGSTPDEQPAAEPSDAATATTDSETTGSDS